MISKEEALKLQEAKSNWYGELKRSIGIENVNVLERMIKSYINQAPTSEEVCNALSERYSIDGIYEIKYVYENEKFGYWYSAGKEKYFQVVDMRVLYSEKQYDLITLIGQFYEGVNKNE